MTGRGHRILPHTADLIVEAWGPDLAACVEEAIAALISICVNVRSASIECTRWAHIGPGSYESLLLAALDEVIFLLDTSPDVPVGADVFLRGDDVGEHLDLGLLLAAPASVEPAGSGPKAISRSGLEVDASPDGVRCCFLVDV
jgi:SHS2 domain-containing protein